MEGIEPLTMMSLQPKNPVQLLITHYNSSITNISYNLEQLHFISSVRLIAKNVS